MFPSITFYCYLIQAEVNSVHKTVDFSNRDQLMYYNATDINMEIDTWTDTQIDRHLDRQIHG